MMPRSQLITILVLVLLAVFIILILIAKLILSLAFNLRSDGSPRLKYFQASDFPGLARKPISFLSNKKQQLNGYIYYYPNCPLKNELITFLHGIGAGHSAYTKEINRFALEGYRVLAFDYTGCVLSEGKSIKSLLQPLVDLKFLFKYMSANEELRDLDVILVGHSWGAFVALNALGFKKTKIKKVVSISGFNSVASIMKMNHPALGFFLPFINFYNFLHYGKLAYTTSVKSLKKTKAPVLIIHGDKDPVVHPKKSFALFDKKTTHKENLQFLLIAEKMHNPYLTSEAEYYLQQVSVDKGLLSKKAPIKDYPVDYDLITKQDEMVIKEIITFLKQ